MPPVEGSDDRLLLRQFVVWVRGFLAELVDSTQSSRVYGSLFAAELHEPMRRAWDEAVTEFAAVERGVSDLPADQIARSGLGGAQLRFKLAAVAWRTRLFRNRPASGLLRRLLDAIDTLLDSILAAVPGGTAVSEIKDAIRDSVKGPRED